MNEIPSDNWISIEEAAEYLGVKPVTVRNWIRKRMVYLLKNREVMEI